MSPGKGTTKVYFSCSGLINLIAIILLQPF